MKKLNFEHLSCVTDLKEEVNWPVVIIEIINKVNEIIEELNKKN